MAFFAMVHYTLKINHGQPWFSNVPWQRMQLIGFYEICTKEIPFEERCYYDTLYTNGMSEIFKVANCVYVGPPQLT